MKTRYQEHVALRTKDRMHNANIKKITEITNEAMRNNEQEIG